jgi:large subunit ribosomal protein L35
MPKIKTHKSSYKRIKLTGTGKMLRARGSVNHGRMRRRSSVRREVEAYFPVATRGERKSIRRLLAYGRGR